MLSLDHCLFAERASALATGVQVLQLEMERLSLSKAAGKDKVCWGWLLAMLRTEVR
jgi:hypothetical protein